MTHRSTVQSTHGTLPDITVVIPSRDRPGLVRRAIDVALAQTDVALEVVVIDDGSVPALQLEPHPAVRLLRNTVSVGVAAARNQGIAEARGGLLAFLDDDDLWAPSKLSAQVAAMASTSTRWCATGTVCLTEELNVRWTAPPPPSPVGLDALRRYNVIGTPSGVLIETALLREVGGFDPQFSVFADWDLWLRVAAVAPASTVAEPLLGYVTHDGSMHRQSLRDTAAELRALAAHHRRATGGVLEMTETWRWLGIAQLERGRLAAGLGTLLWTGVRRASCGALTDPLRPVSERLRAKLGRQRVAPPWLERAQLSLRSPVLAQPARDGR